MTIRFLLFLLLISSLFVFLEWGKGNQMFLYQIEGEILNKLFTDPKSVLHPFIILPLIGQLLLLYSLFVKSISKKVIVSGVVCIGILVLFIFVVGLLSRNMKIVLSTLPFLVFCTLLIFKFNKKNISIIK